MKTRSTDGVIKYTTNGKKPTKDSKTYLNPIKIEEGMVIKAFTYKSKTIVSQINTFEFHVGKKTPVVYLSRQNKTIILELKDQDYTNEYLMMKKVN